MFQDLRFALRSLRKNALLSVVIVATLTLGIGVSTGVFTWYNAVYLRARVDKDHASFVKIYSGYTNDPTQSVIPRKTTWEDYQAYRDGAKSLGILAAWGEVSAPFGHDDPAVARAALVSCNFFALYDPGQPLLGRLLRPEDCAAANPVVVLSERLWRNRFAADPQAPGQAMRKVALSTVSANYFATLEISIISGRALREEDPPCGKGVCSIVVSERLAREFWPNEVPLGKALRLPEGDSYEVVGVARDTSSTKLGGLDDPMIYRPWNPNAERPANPFVRFAGDEATIARAVTGAIREVAPELPVEAATIQAVREHTMESVGKTAQLVVFLCVIAVILAVVSIYGVVAFAVNRRAKEMGIRLALGARSPDIYRAVLGSSGRPVAVGLLIGLALSVAAFSALAPLVRNAEIAINVWDPFNYVIAAVALTAAALAAMLGPARRATKIDPMATLRRE